MNRKINKKNNMNFFYHTRVGVGGGVDVFLAFFAGFVTVSPRLFLVASDSNSVSSSSSSSSSSGSS